MDHMAGLLLAFVDSAHLFHFQMAIPVWNQPTGNEVPLSPPPS